MAAAFPRRGTDPLLIDLSLSEVARGKVMVAAKEGKPIPIGWALDANGNATTDAKAALEWDWKQGQLVSDAMMSQIREEANGADV